MIRDDDHSSEATDVGIVNLSDRRIIRDQEAQIADLERQLAEARERVKPGLANKLAEDCYHHGRFVVSDHRMEVECEECGAQMDPYVVLRKIAHREVNFCYTLNALREERKKLTEEVGRLKKQRSYQRRARNCKTEGTL